MDDVLSWMFTRLDGQKNFNIVVEDTVKTAKEHIKRAVEEKRQAEEQKLMREAEEESIAYAKVLKEQEEALAAAKKEKEKQEAE